MVLFLTESFLLLNFQLCTKFESRFDLVVFSKNFHTQVLITSLTKPRPFVIQNRKRYLVNLTFGVLYCTEMKDPDHKQENSSEVGSGKLPYIPFHLKGVL